MSTRPSNGVANEGKPAHERGGVLLPGSSFDSVIDHVPQGIVVVDKEFRVVALNRRMEELFRLPAGTLRVGADFREVVRMWARETHQGAAMEARALAELEMRERFNFQFSQEIGSKQCWIELTHDPTPDGGFVRTFTDISEIKEVSEALRQSVAERDKLIHKADAILENQRQAERRFRDIVEHTTNIYYRHTPDHVLTYISPQVRQFFGCEPEEALVQWTEFLTDNPVNRKGFESTLRALDTGIAQPPYELELRGKNGRIVWAEVHEAPVMENGKAVAIVGSLTDITERKTLDAELRSSVERLKIVFEYAPDAIYLHDMEGVFVDGNAAAEGVTGYRRDELVGKSFFTAGLLSLNQLSKATEALSRNAAGHPSGPDEYEIRRKDGSKAVLEIRTFPVTVGSRLLVLGIARDISERKQTETALRDAEAKYHGIFEGIPIGIYQSTVDGNFLDVNTELVRILGFDSPAQLTATDLRNKFYVKTGRRNEFLQRIRETGGVSGFESLVYRKDGKTIWISENAHALFNEQGVLTGFEGTIMDITAHKLAIESTQRLERAVEQANDVVFMTDPRGRINYVNPAFEQTYGYTREEVLMQTPRILKSGAHDAALYARLWDTILSGHNFRAEFTNKCKGGELVTMESSITPVLDSDLGLSGFIAVQRNVTQERKIEEERKRLEQQLFQSQKLESIGTLAGGIAHDFNNVLGIILGYATSLHGNLAGDPQAARHIDTIKCAVQRGADLVKQILMFARKTETTFMPLDINTIVLELKRMAEETFPKTIVVAADLEAEIPRISADRTQMHQTLLNLMVNARDAMPNGGMIFMKTGKATLDELRSHVPNAQGTDFIRISVSDTGVGMDEITKLKIFEPFFSTKGPGKGTGLGLAVVHGIIQNHKGYIDVQSEPGLGSTFTLFFPVIAAAIQTDRTLPEAVPETNGGHETIFLIEDEPMLRELVQVSLEAKGYNVITASDGEEAVRLYAQSHNDIELVISDLGLPRLDGASVVAEFMRINPGVKMLIASGYIEPEARTEFHEAGVIGFVQKPYAPPELLNRVREALDASHE